MEHALDAKGRVALPTTIRSSFADGGAMVQWKGPCVALLDRVGFDRWIEYLRTTLPNSGYPDPADHLRLAHSFSAQFKPDIQGRFQLPERLRVAAEIDRQITIVGAGSHVELWNPAGYGGDLEDKRQNIEFLMDDFDLHSGGA